MKRRIFSWVLLGLFVLLLLNIIVFRVYWQLSMVIYLIIAFAFIFTQGRRDKSQYYTEDADDNKNDKATDEINDDNKKNSDD